MPRPSRRPPGLERRGAARGAEGVRAREARVRVRGGARPWSPPPTPAVSAPLALVCGAGVGGGWRRLEPEHRPHYHHHSRPQT